VDVACPSYAGSDPVASVRSSGRYGTSLMFSGDDTVKIEDPFPVSFPLSDLQDFA
jgi:hypothetical protein